MLYIRGVFFICLLFFVSAFAKPLNVSYIQPENIVEYASKRRTGVFRDLQVYCYRGSSKSFSALFQSVNLELNFDNDFELYEGSTPDIVAAHYDNQRSIFSFNSLTRKMNLIDLNPFIQTCVGIETAHQYNIYLNLIHIDFWKMTLMSIGLSLFFAANQFSEIPLFYYATGILVGIFASLLIVVYFLAKLFPKKPIMAGGSAIEIFFSQLLWDRVQLILFSYQSYVLWYILVTGFISSLICYRLGKPKNPRSKNLVKWGLQMVAMLIIYFSSQIQEASVGFAVLTFCIYYFPVKWLNIFRGYRWRRFPPKRRFLTNEEYDEQTALETTKALEELRNYCSSPESQPWRTLTKLQNPHRFASFMEGQPHLLGSEMFEYEALSSIYNSDISNDEDDDSEDDVNNRTGLLQQPVNGPTFRIWHSALPTSTPRIGTAADSQLNKI